MNTDSYGSGSALEPRAMPAVGANDAGMARISIPDIVRRRAASPGRAHDDQFTLSPPPSR